MDGRPFLWWGDDVNKSSLPLVPRPRLASPSSPTRAQAPADATMATGPTTMEGVDQPVHATRPRPRPPRSSPPDSATDADDGSVDDERRPSPADIFLEAAQAIESRGRVSPPELTAIEPTDEVDVLLTQARGVYIYI